MPPRPDRRPRAAGPRRGRPKRLVVAIGVSALALAGACVASAFALNPPAADTMAQVTRPDDRPLRVLFVGDSISYGLDAKLQDRGFRPVMVDALSTDGPVREFHKNRAGATTATVSGLVNVPENLDLALVELGTNDVVARTGPTEFEQSYESLLRRVHTESPDVPLVCVGTWGSAGGADGSDAYNAVIEDACARQGGAFVSLYGLYPEAANRGPAGRAVFGGTSDRFHPNDRGYRVIAELILGRISVR
ncbi:MAG: SGNH/GDSL hydrolase family protein [Ramlibacter sp.]|nr:SGNH/GDSL hydrolase family protein [Cryobacterium sp.]